MNKLILFGILAASTLFAQSPSGFPFGLFSVSGSGTQITLNSDCSPTTPCVTGPADSPTATFSPSQVSIPSGNSSANDRALIYIDILNPSVVSVGTKSTPLTCTSGCVSKTGITEIPVGSRLLFSWPIVNGQFQAYNSTYDFRNYMPLPTNYKFGSGLLTTTTNGITTISLDTSYVGTSTSIPTSFNFPISFINPGMLDGVGQANLYATDPRGYTTFTFHNKNSVQEYSMGMGGPSTGFLQNTFYLYDNTKRQTIFNNVYGTTQLQAYGNTINVTLPQAPTSSTSACTVGQTAFDANYYYICVSSNLWKRFSLGSF